MWEANHVWLIFCLVVLWTAFSEAFASITLTLFVPLTLAALGIVLRGSSFAFRKALVRTPQQRVFGGDLRDLVGPRAVLHGRGRRRDRVGPRARGRQGRRSVVELGQPDVDPRRRARGDRRARTSRPCTSCGTPAASSDDAMVEYFRRRAVVAAVVAGVVAFVGIFVLHADATYVFHGLTSRALPLVILSALCGLISLLLLVRGAHRGARVLLATGAVASVIWAWGVAQWPYILPTSLKVSDAAAPSGTLTAVLVVFGVAAVTIVPALGFLYVLDQKSLLPQESVGADVLDVLVSAEPTQREPAPDRGQVRGEQARGERRRDRFASAGSRPR